MVERLNGSPPRAYKDHTEQGKLLKTLPQSMVEAKPWVMGNTVPHSFR